MDIIHVKLFNNIIEIWEIKIGMCNCNERITSFITCHSEETDANYCSIFLHRCKHTLSVLCIADGAWQCEMLLLNGTIAKAFNGKNVSVCRCGVSSNEQMMPLTIVKIGLKNNACKTSHIIPSAYMNEKERCLQPCPAHDPQTLLYCIYVHLQLSSECSSGKVQLSCRFVSFWMVVNPQWTQISSDLKLNHTQECACVGDFHWLID